MISKSLGQILRVSSSMHTLFNLECEELCSTITKDAIDAAIHFVEVCCQQTAYIAGRGELDKELDLIVKGMYSYTMTLTILISIISTVYNPFCIV